MNKTFFPALPLLLVAGFWSVSAQESVESASPEILRDAAARAESARKRASDFETQFYFPSDWDAADAQYAAVRLPADVPETAAEFNQVVDEYNAAAAAFDNLFNKAVSLYAMGREDDIVAARDEFVATGLARLVPEYLRQADHTAVLALSEYEAEDYYAARDIAEKALDTYQTLKAGADVWLTRLEVVDRGFDSGDAGYFALADRIALDAADAYDRGDIAAARDGAEEALLRYTLLLVDGLAAESGGVEIAVVESPVPSANPPSAGQEPLPAHYIVRSWEETRDCFWNIAGRPGVYGDPRQWRLIYEANKSRLPDPNNPGLIEAGMILDIPALKGEIRQGTWDPAKTYSTLP
jgi:tetratricopeptide (TPR) repeat protein